MKAKPVVQISLAAFPGLRHEDAAHRAINEVVREPLWGAIGCEHVQLVPQCNGLIDESFCDDLKEAFPETKFRLHANVRVLQEHTIADISGLNIYKKWFKQAALISKSLGAPAYTAHSGSRTQSTMNEMFENARKLADLFECPVGIEGQYPSEHDTMLVSSWNEYRQVFDSGVPYVLDLSHLNILAAKSGQQERSLVTEMLACERCIEVHLSDNDGSGDWHQVCESKPWWLSLLPYVNSAAVLFTEGNHRRSRSV
jgi:sugar phosphate isomerase/epimerase